MILGEKITNLRKQNGWSQEELAEMMNVSRQSVSKWEGSQSVPDLDKILKLANIFGVTTDYLLKDSCEIIEYTEEEPVPASVRTISLQEANEYLELRRNAASKIALGVFLCIISPLIMIILGVLSDIYPLVISENTAGFIGISSLLFLISIAVGIFIYYSNKSYYFNFMEEELFETAYGVAGMVREKQKIYRDIYIKYNIIGAVLCILAPIILLSAAFLAEDNDLIIVITLCTMLLIIAFAVFLFIKVGVVWSSMNILLQEGDYTKEKKKHSKVNGTIAAVYWLLGTAIFLYTGLKNGSFSFAAYYWPVAALIYAAIAVTIELIQNKQ